MSKPPCLVIILLTLTPILCNNCNNTISVNTYAYECRYKVSYPNGDQCSDFNFQQCRIIPNNNSLPPFNYHTIEECNAYCCQDTYSYNLFCNQQSDTSNYFVIVIAALASFIFLFIALLCLYRLRADLCYCCLGQCFRRASINNNNPDHVQHDTMSNLEPIEKIWELDGSFSIKNECSVCLCDQANFVLPCGHVFHKNCILECFKRKYECILCRKTQMSQFRHYCRRCLKRWAKVFFYELRSLRDQKDETTCDVCIRTISLEQ